MSAKMVATALILLALLAGAYLAFVGPSGFQLNGTDGIATSEATRTSVATSSETAGLTPPTPTIRKAAETTAQQTTARGTGIEQTSTTKTTSSVKITNASFTIKQQKINVTEFRYIDQETLVLDMKF